MAEGTRVRELQQQMESAKGMWEISQSQQAQIQSQQTQMQNQINQHGVDIKDLSSKMDQLLEVMMGRNSVPGMETPTFVQQGPLEGRHIRETGESSFGFQKTRLGNGPDVQVRSLKLDFPHFDGENVSGWLFKVKQFFDFSNSPIEYKVPMASFYMDGDALVWFQDASDLGLFTSWEAFESAIQFRFGPNCYDDPMEALTRLRQTSSIAIYKTQFERLSNRLKGLSEGYKLSCFLSGLRDEIRFPLRLLKPRTLNEAFGLAKIQEEFVLSSRKNYRSSGVHTTSFFQQNNNSFQSNIPKPGLIAAGKSDSTEVGFPVGKPKPALQVQRITPTQMEERRRKGLCYYCDEKYNAAHRCQRGKVFLMEGCELISDEHWMIPESEGIDNSGEDYKLQNEVVEETHLEISLHVITGSPNPETMRLIGSVKSFGITILVDSGSSHNFVDPVVVAKLQVVIHKDSRLAVKVANGQIVHTEGYSPALPVKVQGTNFSAEFYLLPLRGCDMVLGVHWLRSLGPILWDFSKLTMEFSLFTKRVLWKGLAPTDSVWEDGHIFSRIPKAKQKGLVLQMVASVAHDSL
jgi:hypothetical protein